MHFTTASLLTCALMASISTVIASNCIKDLYYCGFVLLQRGMLPLVYELLLLMNHQAITTTKSMQRCLRHIRATTPTTSITRFSSALMTITQTATSNSSNSVQRVVRMGVIGIAILVNRTREIFP